MKSGDSLQRSKGSPAPARERLSQIPVVGAIVLLTLLAWAYLLHLHRQMAATVADADAMGVMGMPMDQSWTRIDAWFAFVMWSVMMAAMMLPSAAPLILLYGAAARRSEQRTARLRT